MELMHRCEKCDQEFMYDPKHHRCPGEWEAMVPTPVIDPYEGMSWVEEQMTKQRG